jgi:hypothetical protein
MPLATSSSPPIRAPNARAPQTPVENSVESNSAVEHTRTDTDVSETIRADLRQALHSALGLNSPSGRSEPTEDAVRSAARDYSDAYKRDAACPTLPSLANIGTRPLPARPWAALGVWDEKQRSSYGGINTLGATPYSDERYVGYHGIDTRSSSVKYGIREPDADASK